MDALILCGGEGSRLDAEVEKPLFEIADRPMIDHVLEALEASSIDDVHAAVSPQAPNTKRHVQGRCELIETPGEGYVADLSTALADLEQPVLTVTADLPLLTGEVVDSIQHDWSGNDSLSVVVPVSLKRALGASIDTQRDGVAPAGINIVADSSESSTHVSYDARLAVNVNRRTDVTLAQRLHPAAENSERPSADGGDHS